MKQTLGLLIITGVIIGTFSFPNKAEACSCAIGTPEEHYNNADLVFIGEVNDVSNRSNPAYGDFPQSADVTLNVSKYWKMKDVGATVKIIAANDGMCGWSIPGEKVVYLMYLRKTEPSTNEGLSYTTTICAGNKEISDAKEDLEFLENKKSYIPEGVDTEITEWVSPFQRNLKLGDVGEDVRQLQQLLNRNLVYVSVSGVGSPGNETTYFGAKTKAALTKFQTGFGTEIGVTVGTGFFGPLTRKFMERFLIAPPLPQSGTTQ